LVGGELGRMVSKKKTAKKDAGTTEKVEAQVDEASGLSLAVEPEVEAKTVNVDEESTLEVPEKASTTKTETAEQPIEEPKAAFVDETTKLLNLLGDSPPVPLILTIEDAVKFVDRYRVWKLKVKAETG
jgi:hypothetical protein